MNITEKFLQFTLLGAEWVLWLLVVLSVFSVYVMIERALFFRSVSSDDVGLRKRLMDALAAGEIADAKRLLKNAVGSGARVVRSMLDSADRGPTAIAARRDAVRPEERIRLEKNLAYLGTLGANAPFIGLFGTVLGIIRAFNDLAKEGLQAGGDSTEAVMAGISEALVATAVGLLVAIPAVVAYNTFQRRVKRMLGEAEAMSNTALALLTNADISSASDDDGEKKKKD